VTVFTLVWTETFSRTAKRFLRKHPDLVGQFGAVVRQLERDPSHPRLKLHPLRGKHRGKHAVSLTYSYRIVLVIVVEDDEIVLLDIGSHDEVYR